uniref:Uncharacterized protein n=1 Tax=Anopheles christyi TaxID=43041 RepID=A0A182KJ46_9DIPT
MDNARRSVRFHFERTGIDHPRKVLLAFTLAQIQQLSHTLQIDACVVVGYDSHVMLDQPVLQLRPTLFAVAGLLVEDVERVQFGTVHRAEGVEIDQLLAHEQT